MMQINLIFALILFIESFTKILNFFMVCFGQSFKLRLWFIVEVFLLFFVLFVFFLLLMKTNFGKAGKCNLKIVRLEGCWVLWGQNIQKIRSEFPTRIFRIFTKICLDLYVNYLTKFDWTYTVTWYLCALIFASYI